MMLGKIYVEPLILGGLLILWLGIRVDNTVLQVLSLPPLFAGLVSQIEQILCYVYLFPHWYLPKRPWLTLWGSIICFFHGHHHYIPKHSFLTSVDLAIGGNATYNVYYCLSCGQQEIVFYKEPLSIWLDT